MRLSALATLSALMVLAIEPWPAWSAAAQDYPPAFPRDGGTKMMENAWGAVWDAVYTPGKPTPMHRHRFDFVGVELAESTVTITEPDGRIKTFPTPRGSAYFLPRGVTHIEETPLGSPPRHAILIDLKEDAPATALAAASLSAPFPANGAKPIVDNARVTMWDVTWPAGRAIPVSPPGRNAFIVFIDGGELMLSGPGEETHSLQVHKGLTVFRPAGTAMSAMSAKGVVRGVVVALK